MGSTSILYTERLAEAQIESSVGSVGDSYDNAMAESIIGLYKTEMIWPRGPWKNLDEVEYATLGWVNWYNNQRLLEPIGNIPPVEFEAAYYEQENGQPDSHKRVSGIPGAVQFGELVPPWAQLSSKLVIPSRLSFSPMSTRRDLRDSNGRQ